MDSEERGTPKVEDVSLTQTNKDDNTSPNASGVKPIVDDQREQVTNVDSLTDEIPFTWEEEISDAPELPKHYKKVAESKLPITSEDFFDLFFSNEAIDFVESFHKKCGDKDFKCNQWYPHDQLGKAREISYQHPIKVYFGAKYGGCKEVQSFRVYRDSHVIINTSQEISDVPYADYFQVEGLWDVQRDVDQSENGCIIQVHINVAFSKRTVWKGKIEQSTKEECREAYATWIELAHHVLKERKLEKTTWRELAHEVLKQRNVEITEVPSDVVESGEDPPKGHHEILKPLERSQEERNIRSRKASPIPQGSRQQSDPPSLQATLLDITTLASLFRLVSAKAYSLLESQGNNRMPHVLVLAVVLFLMQLGIVVLLGRPQQVYIIPQVGTGNGLGVKGYQRGVETVVPWLEKRILLLKDEMLIIETHLERMRHEHIVIKAHLKDVELQNKKSR